MDPNANLTEQREIVARMLDETQESPDGFANDALRLAELIQALDEWISNGGFLPIQWGHVRDHKRVVVRRTRDRHAPSRAAASNVVAEDRGVHSSRRVRANETPLGPSWSDWYVDVVRNMAPTIFTDTDLNVSPRVTDDLCWCCGGNVLSAGAGYACRECDIHSDDDHDGHGETCDTHERRADR